MELRPLFVEARDFVAGLIRAFGLPARLSYGGMEPARDGQQLIIDVRAYRGAADSRYRGARDRDDERSDELAMLIGKHGATLDALSALTNAAMHRDDRRDIFFTVDVEGYRGRRLATLRSMALRSAERVARNGNAEELDPMAPSERRVVHLTLANHRDVRTESTGDGRERRVVVLPRDDRPRERDTREREFEHERGRRPTLQRRGVGAPPPRPPRFVSPVEPRYAPPPDDEEDDF